MLDRLESERRDSARRALAAQEDERAADRARAARRDRPGADGGGAAARACGAATRSRRCAARSRRRARRCARASRRCARSRAGCARRRSTTSGLGSALAALTLDVSRRTGLRVERAHRRRAVRARRRRRSSSSTASRRRRSRTCARHAGARARGSRSAAATAGVALEVRDDGAGFEPDAAAGAGLRGMRERALLVGADARRRVARAEGTAVRLTLRAERHDGAVPGPAADRRRPRDGAPRAAAGARRASPTCGWSPRRPTAPRRSRRVRETEIDLAVLDVSMPRMTGLAGDGRAARGGTRSCGC